MKKFLIALFAFALISPSFAEDEAAQEMEYGADAALVSTQVQAAANAARMEYIKADDQPGDETDDQADKKDFIMEINDILDQKEDAQRRKEKLPHGLQFGAGVTVMPGHNWFIGYANKNHRNFWLKRLGVRLDMTTPMRLNAKATVKDVYENGDLIGYEINPEFNLWFKKFKYTDFTDDKLEIDVVELDDRPLSFDDAHVRFNFRHRNIGALADFYPFGNTWFLGGLRVSGGYYAGSLRSELHANFPNHTPADGFIQTLNNNDELKFRIRGGSRFGANIDWKYRGPYVGLGFDLGLLLGAKIYMDAGAVYTKPLKLTERNFNDNNMAFEACYSYDGAPCAWLPLLEGMNPPEVDRIIREIITPVLAGQIQSQLPALPGLPIDVNLITNDLVNFMLTGSEAGWMAGILGGNQDIWDAIVAVRDEYIGNGFQDEIDNIWGDYQQQKIDAINDANKAISDCGSGCRFMPMVRLGFMFRF
ncbi:MAG: hypothetical protein FWD33_01790 [Alphaproteobacteria bacterium]|nr:hypothetical protein [Alphaproteobacteria bacterium]